ncbi:hypothetical protein EXIGLDRAFT_642868, partial [Exidia glandulosa HHB12029]
MMPRLLTTLMALASALVTVMAAPSQIPLADNVEINDCGTDDDWFKLDKIEATPYPPRSGENVTVYAVGTVYKAIEEGAFVDITVKLGLIKIHTERVDICKIVEENGERECPLEPGEYTVNQTVTIPGVAPLGRYSIEARGYSGEEAEEA